MHDRRVISRAHKAIMTGRLHMTLEKQKQVKP